MKSHVYDVHNMSNNAHVRRQIYQEFYHGIIYIVNGGCHIRITINLSQTDIHLKLPTLNMTSLFPPISSQTNHTRIVELYRLLRGYSWTNYPTIRK